MTAHPLKNPSVGFLERIGQTRLLVSVCLLLVVVTLAVYWPVKDYGFINFDDDLYVTGNRQVQKGMTIETVKWAFTTGDAFNWHPLTWLSHLMDVQFFGLEAGRHHLVNVFFHILNTVLLFLILHSLTRAPGSSAFVAVLFALHPLHVESVAWVAERKDVLSAFFWLLSLGAYVSYVRRADYRWYLPALLFFIFGLMSKPMLVTMPFLLLLLDYWPLARFQAAGGGTGPPRSGDSPDGSAGKSRKRERTAAKKVAQREGSGAGPSRWSLWRLLLLEKIPFLAFSIISSVITLYVQQETVRSLQRYPLDVRLANAAISYVKYLGMMLWPRDLAVFYPHPGMQPLGSVLGAVLCLVAITLLVIWKMKRFPYLGAGWFWYLVTMLPVIGLVQVGSQAMADRYSYVPLIGIFIMIAWGIPDLIPRGSHRTPVLWLLAGGATLACIILTGAQVRIWRNTETLLRHALQVTRDNYVAHTNLAGALSHRGAHDEAIVHFQSALKIVPDSVEGWRGLGDAYEQSGRIAEAVEAFQQALRSKPNHVEALIGLGKAYSKSGRLTEAVAAFQEALLIEPDSAEALNNLGVAYVSAGQVDRAIELFRRTLADKPNQADVWNNLGIVYGRSGKMAQAVEAFQEALRINPAYAEAWNNLGNAYGETGRIAAAIAAFEQAIRIRPEYAEALNNLGVAYAESGQFAQAIRPFRQALEITPGQADVWTNLGVALRNAGRTAEAVEAFREALRIKPAYVKAWVGLGLAYRASGQQEQVREVSKRLRAIDPAAADAFSAQQ